MIWLSLALFTAVATAAKEVLIKGAVRRTRESVVVFWIGAVVALALAPAALVAGGFAVEPAFWPALAVSGAVNIVAGLLIARALRLSDISLVAPLQSLTPAFMLLTAPIILGERVGPLGLAGVAAITAGSYVLASPGAGARLGAPFVALFRDPGARLMFVVAFLFSISASVDKVGVLAADPLTWAASVHAVIAAALLPRVLRRPAAAAKRAASPGWVRPRLLAEPAAGRALDGAPDPASPPVAAARTRSLVLLVVGAGAAAALAAAAQMTALELTLAAYVIAVKRTSILFAILAGGFVFRERGIPVRLAGAALMVAGVILIGWR